MPGPSTISSNTPPNMILKLENPELGFQFEWHPESRGLFCMWFSGAKHEQIAAGITTPEMAHLAAMMWCRGYQSKSREVGRRPGSKHYHMFAETGAVGTKPGTKF